MTTSEIIKKFKKNNKCASFKISYEIISGTNSDYIKVKVANRTDAYFGISGIISAKEEYFEPARAEALRLALLQLDSTFFDN